MNISQLPLTHSIALSHGIINFSAFSLLTSTTLSLLIYCHLSLLFTAIVGLPTSTLYTDTKP